MTELAAVRAALGTATLGPALAAFAKLAMVLVFAGLSFRVAAVPFHFYAPDVYQGTTHPNAALLSVVPKAAGLLAMVRILAGSMPGMAPYSWQLVLAVALLTMTLANLMALWQDDLRRLLAYSAIAHAGYMLLALAAALAGGASVVGTLRVPDPEEWNGLAALWFYLPAYALATLGAFAVLEHLGAGKGDRLLLCAAPSGPFGQKVPVPFSGPDGRLDAVDQLAGLGRRRPAAAAVLAVCLLSLTGVPPLAGFWGKFWVFGAALNVGTSPDAAAGPRGWFIAAAVIGVLNAAVAAAYYLRLVAVMYFRARKSRKRGQVQFAATNLRSVPALRVLRTNWTCPLFRPASAPGRPP